MLAGREASRRVVAALDRAAHKAGLVRGMPLARAQAMVPGLCVMQADPHGDAEALERLAVWALRYSPVAAADHPDGLVLDTGGADHLHGGEAAMLADMVARLGARGISARAAVADTLGAAHAAARFLPASPVVVPQGRAQAMLRPLPLAALRLDPETVLALRTLGFETAGDLMDRPRAPFALRFGPEPGRRLDQALGTAAEPIEPVRAPGLAEARRVFAEPIGAPETIARAIAGLVGALCAELEERGLGARRLDLLFRRVDNSLQVVRAGMAQPVRDTARLTRLLCEKIATVDPGCGIEAMVLTATAAERLAARQAVSSLAAEAGADISDLVDVLMNRVGERHVHRFAAVESDVPERSVRCIGPLAGDDGAGWKQEWPRPSRLFPRPERIETMALLPDHPPVWFVWRGTRHRVRRADGPERIFGEWWKRDAEARAVRDYFRVEDEAGERYWIFRAGDGEDPRTGAHDWFLHGVFA